MIFMSPTALSVRYLDKSQKWLELEAGSRDKALNFIEQGLLYAQHNLMTICFYLTFSGFVANSYEFIQSHSYIFV